MGNIGYCGARKRPSSMALPVSICPRRLGSIVAAPISKRNQCRTGDLVRQGSGRPDDDGLAVQPLDCSSVFRPNDIVNRTRRPQPMHATDPLLSFLLVVAIGVAAGILFDRLAGPSWLARQFSGSTRGILTSALVGVAGAFIGYEIAVLLALGGGLLTSAIAAALGAAAVLFAWRTAK